MHKGLVGLNDSFIIQFRKIRGPINWGLILTKKFTKNLNCNNFRNNGNVGRKHYFRFSILLDFILISFRAVELTR